MKKQKQKQSAMSWLKKLLSNPLGTKIEVRDLSPQDWNEGDARALKQFLSSHCGQKLLKMLNLNIVNIACSIDPCSEREDGIRQGLSMAKHTLEELCKTEEPIEVENEVYAPFSYEGEYQLLG